MNEILLAATEAGRMIARADSALFEIVFLSLRVSLTAVVLASAIGLPLGAAIAVGRFPGRQALIVMLNALMGLPPVVVGLILFMLLSLGDCSLVVEPAGGEAYVAGDAAGLSPGDRRTADAMRHIQQSSGARSWAEARGHLLPRLRRAREGLNRPGGYGAFSVVPVPAEFVRVVSDVVLGADHRLVRRSG